MYVLFIRSQSCHGSMSEFVGTACLTQEHSEGRHRHTAPRAPPQVFLLTNTIGQRNRNTLAINSKRTPSERNNELQESCREQVQWSREESTSCPSRSQTLRNKPNRRRARLPKFSTTTTFTYTSAHRDRTRGIAGVRLDWTRRGTHGLEAGDGRPRGRPLRQRVMLTVPQARWSTVGSPRKRLCRDGARRGPPVRAWTRRPKGGHS